MLIKASLLEEYELLPGLDRKAAALTRFIMVPSSPKVWMKDWIVMMVPLTLVSYGFAIGQRRTLYIQYGVVQ